MIWRVVSNERESHIERSILVEYNSLSSTPELTPVLLAHVMRGIQRIEKPGRFQIGVHWEELATKVLGSLL